MLRNQDLIVNLHGGVYFLCDTHHESSCFLSGFPFLIEAYANETSKTQYLPIPFNHAQNEW